MEATEKGVLLRVDGVIDMTGTTAIELLVRGPTETTFRALAMALVAPPNIAERFTLVTDFPESGNYHIQLRATFADGRVLKSPLTLLHVGECITLGLC